MKICGNGDEFEISNSIWIYLDFAYRGFLLEPEVGKDFSFLISKRSSQMFSDDVRRCLSLKTMPYLMPSHAIFKMKAGYTDIQAPKATAMMAKNLPKFGVPLKVSAFSGDGQDITERLKALMGMS